MTSPRHLLAESTSSGARLRKLLLEQKSCTVSIWNSRYLDTHLETRQVYGAAKREDTMRRLNFSLVYICPQCSKDWLRIDLRNNHWLPDRRLCPQHGKGYMLPWELDYWALIPTAVLRREVILLNKFKETKQGYRAHLVTGGL